MGAVEKKMWSFDKVLSGRRRPAVQTSAAKTSNCIHQQWFGFGIFLHTDKLQRAFTRESSHRAADYTLTKSIGDTTISNNELNTN